MEGVPTVVGTHLTHDTLARPCIRPHTQWLQQQLGIQLKSDNCRLVLLVRGTHTHLYQPRTQALSRIPVRGNEQGTRLCLLHLIVSVPGTGVI